MDLLSEILTAAAWKSDLLARTPMYKAWGLRFPCERSGGFHILSQGSCYVRFKGKILSLEKGDILFIAKGLDHELISSPANKAMDIGKFREFLKKGNRFDGKPITTFVSVRYEVPETAQHPFFLELPDLILIRSSEIPSHHPLHTTLVLISQEVDSGLGSDLILQKLTDILLYYVIRHWLETNPSRSPGWRSAFKDEKIRSVLEVIHKKPAHPWTLETLASSVGISRASLANRFREVLGCTPMDYLSRLRIEKGRNLIQEQGATLEEVSRVVGYSSAFAFSKAFKRIHGVSPKNEESWKKRDVS
ncbi:AraC family transcriptional regulator [Leptospira gomenensis]|uniref:AraC family transcriptional regulator n=1 Tax=Leptospira gomenensis TaxID=2484974 RepID=A0A5F1YAH3_9LEPT|nr:AraC family transcriptional regulator [Leptospira gomenensis]TGK33309.1 AraC family transcriptional regulator [Leptospira gomenensis]TGK37395.1 AraC family transcriptional regulator [Leptospira gomenensis]TGK50883.1 AraC family transcriptional regulator [Leptospira gomenensis]TGK56506.1 AraC family transcriptional regulator [Leptospira gomenensis]